MPQKRISMCNGFGASLQENALKYQLMAFGFRTSLVFAKQSFVKHHYPNGSDSEHMKRWKT